MKNIFSTQPDFQTRISNGFTDAVSRASATPVGLAGAVTGLAAVVGLGALAMVRARRDERSVRAKNQPRNSDGTFKTGA